jgi:ferric-dicitrate binding protein FerR (iron transport regulator)
MSNFNHIEITDEILIAFIANELDVDFAAYIKDWIKKDVVNENRYNELVKTWEFVGTIQPSPVVVNVDNAWQSVLNKITPEEKIIPLKRNWRKTILWSSAASILILIGIFSILKFTEVENLNVNRLADETGLRDELSDGSIIQLNANSSLSYLSEFEEDERKVAIKGEAFFEITKDEKRPFIVDLQDELYVKVLGTSFNVKSIDGDSITEVYVKTGKVEFGNLENKLLLVPGEKGIFNRKTNQFYKETKASTGLSELYWISGEVNFDGVPLNEVIDVLNTLFDADSKVVLACPDRQNLRIVSSLKKDQSIEQILKVIAEIHGFIIEKSSVGSKQVFTLKCDG